MGKNLFNLNQLIPGYFFIYSSIIEQYNEIMKLNNEQFNILRKISKESNVSQRKMAQDLGYSLGKVNYCLEMKNKVFERKFFLLISYQ